MANDAKAELRQFFVRAIPVEGRDPIWAMLRGKDVKAVDRLHYYG